MVKILFESNDFVAVDKPSLMLTIPPRVADGRESLNLILQKQLGIPLFIVHRLDFEVSGIVLFAKNKLAHRTANLAFTNDEVQKTYEAITEKPAGFDAQEEFFWDFRLVRGKRRSFEAPYGKRALTSGKILSQKNNRLHWTLSPKTGRSHQLRYTLSKIHCPIIGDALYGSKTSANGIDLRAVRIKLLDLDIQTSGLMND